MPEGEADLLSSMLNIDIVERQMMYRRSKTKIDKLVVCAQVSSFCLIAQMTNETLRPSACPLPTPRLAQSWSYQRALTHMSPIFTPTHSGQRQISSWCPYSLRHQRRGFQCWQGVASRCLPLIYANVVLSSAGTTRRGLESLHDDN